MRRNPEELEAEVQGSDKDKGCSEEAQGRLPLLSLLIPYRLPAHWMMPPISRAGLPSPICDPCVNHPQPHSEPCSAAVLDIC